MEDKTGLIFFVASLFVFTTITVSAMTALWRNFITILHVFTLVKKPINSLL
jgi:hypothetical protein